MTRLQDAEPRLIRRADDYPYHTGLMCGLAASRYDQQARTGYLTVTGCTDMEGAIEFFTAIDPQVRRIDITERWETSPDSMCIYIRDDADEARDDFGPMGRWSSAVYHRSR